MARRPTILATGDVTVDWSFVDLGGAPTDAGSMAWAWSEGFDVNAVRFAGGAARLADMLGAVADRSARDVLVIGPALPAEALASPLDASVTRTFSSVARFPASRTDRRPVWRLRTLLGAASRRRASPASAVAREARPSTSSPSTTWDSTTGESPGSGSVWKDRDPRAIVIATIAPFDDDALLPHLLERYARSADRRRARRRASQDRRRDRLPALVGAHRRRRWTPQSVPTPSARPARVVVQLELSGALVVERDSVTTLVFDPSVQEGAWMAEHAGLMPAYPLCYVAALAEPLAADVDFSAVEAVRHAVAATRVLLSRGLGDGTKEELAYPMDAVAAALCEEPSEIHATLHPRSDGSTSIIAGTIDAGAMVDAAMKLALGGPESLPPGVPVEKVGNWSSVDRREIETLRGVGHVIDEYVSLYRGGGVVARPLSVAVFGPPGAGKSFAVKETIGQKVAGGVKTLEFNLSQFNGDAELAPAFHQVRDAVLEQRLPLVFWDEFDTPLEGRELGWLRHFLAPMQDGKFRENGAFHPLGPAIFVFAGGTASSFAEFSAVRDERAEKAAKKPDFISRLRGYVDILGPNKAHADDGAVVLRRALLLRSLLLRKEPQLIAHGASRQTLRMDPAVLRAFLLVDRYHHGARSMEAIIDMSHLAGTFRFERSSLPAPHLLEVHTDAQQFLSLMEG